MGWLERARHRPPQRIPAASTEVQEEAPLERAAPGLANLFDALSEDGRHSVLDLGPASDGHLRMLGSFARRIRFADIVPEPPSGLVWPSGREAIPPNAEHPYDVVLAWDILERLDRSDGPDLVRRLAEVTAPGAWLYTVVDSSGASLRPPVRSKLVALDRVALSVTGPPEPAHEPLLPAHVGRILEPFRVRHAFTLRMGLREYVARKA